MKNYTTQPGEVVHKLSDKRVGYGDLVSSLIMPEELPEINEEQLKNPKDFRLIGTFVPRTDIPAKVDGSAQFAADIRLPDMLYGVYERGRIHGAVPTLKNETAILGLPGVIKVVSIDHAIGVIAKTIEQALSAKEQLNISWSNPKAKGFHSQDIL